MGRHANPDIRRAFAEYQDSETPSKCFKVRCLHCGYVRAKNTTRQIEHLQECRAFQASADAQIPLAPGGGQTQTTTASNNPSTQSTASQILSGQAPNPNLQIRRRGPNAPKHNREGQSIIAPSTPPMVPRPSPSLTTHLATAYSTPFLQATQRPFLSHAGCGTLAQGPLMHWLVQDQHYQRGCIRFIGQMLSKIRLPQVLDSQFHVMYRTMDLLISALNNMRREMQYFEIQCVKYGVTLAMDPISPITRSMLDLLMSSSNSSASILEGMIALWGTQHCYRTAWTYAAGFVSNIPAPHGDTHILALHQAFIPNWTSPAFGKVIDATRALVDELANTASAPDGKEEMVRCEEIFRQICWLSERSWPVVDGMGQQDENTPRLGPSVAPMGGSISNGVNDSMANGMANSMNNSMSNSIPPQNMNTMSAGGLGTTNVNVNVPNGEANGDGRNSFGGSNDNDAPYETIDADD